VLFSAGRVRWWQRDVGLLPTKSRQHGPRPGKPGSLTENRTESPVSLKHVSVRGVRLPLLRRGPSGREGHGCGRHSTHLRDYTQRGEREYLRAGRIRGWGGGRSGGGLRKPRRPQGRPERTLLGGGIPKQSRRYRVLR